MNDVELAKMLFGDSASVVSSESSLVPGRTRTYTGIALEDSSDGYTNVQVNGDMVTGSGESYLRLPTQAAVKAGDIVNITVVNGSPIITGAAGWGDAMDVRITTAQDDALEAVATALDSAHLVITSTAGQLFKNGAESTILQVAVFLSGGGRCDTLDDVRARFGQSARIEWRWRHDSSGTWGTLVSSDPHISHDGMWLTVTPEDVETKTTFEASLVVPD